jgi:hypothetical protein
MGEKFLFWELNKALEWFALAKDRSICFLPLLRSASTDIQYSYAPFPSIPKNLMRGWLRTLPHVAQPRGARRGRDGRAWEGDTWRFFFGFYIVLESRHVDRCACQFIACVLFNYF